MTDRLIDRFQRQHTYLRISVTDRCNFRCRYCMPPEGLAWRTRDEILTFEEIERLARMFADAGVNKIRLTGGEPTVRKGIEELIAKLADIEGVNSLLMTTNGTTLSKKVREYRSAGLGGLNVSIDSLRRERFAEITLRDDLERVLAGIDAAVEAGFHSVKVNVVMMAGVNDDELLDFVEFAKNRPVNVRFIEFMPFEGNGWKQASVFPYRAMLSEIANHYELVPIATEPSAVGKDFAIPGFRGTLGFVTSMTDSFCSGCNRIRLTAEGALKVCLFSGAEVSLRDPMRAGAADDELLSIAKAALDRKWKEHPDLSVLAQVPNRSMVAIGG